MVINEISDKLSFIRRCHPNQDCSELAEVTRQILGVGTIVTLKRAYNKLIYVPVGEVGEEWGLFEYHTFLYAYRHIIDIDTQEKIIPEHRYMKLLVEKNNILSPTELIINNSRLRSVVLKEVLKFKRNNEVITW